MPISFQIKPLHHEASHGKASDSDYLVSTDQLVKKKIGFCKKLLALLALKKTGSLRNSGLTSAVRCISGNEYRGDLMICAERLARITKVLSVDREGISGVAKCQIPDY